MITKEEFVRMQDHSILEPDANEAAILVRINEALQYNFAAVYVQPCWVRFAAERVAGSKVAVGTVIGFPFGENRTEIKIQEALLAIEDGATELDTVINISKLKSGYDREVKDELVQLITAIKRKSPEVLVKVIIDNCYLTHDEKIRACNIVAESGADYIKTSTGTGPSGCRIGDIRLMRRIVRDRCKIKAAAHVKTIEDALAVISEGATRIGENSAVALLQDFDKQLWE
jgi:deoxyribose-phosphate aldolase